MKPLAKRAILIALATCLFIGIKLTLSFVATACLKGYFTQKCELGQYSPSCRSKPVWLSLFYGTQKKIFEKCVYFVHEFLFLDCLTNMKKKKSYFVFSRRKSVIPVLKTWAWGWTIPLRFLCTTIYSEIYAWQTKEIPHHALFLICNETCRTMMCWWIKQTMWTNTKAAHL